MGRRRSNLGLLIFAVAVAACVGDQRTSVELSSDGTVAVRGASSPAGSLSSVNLGDTVEVVADPSAQFVVFDSLARILYHRGVRTMLLSPRGQSRGDQIQVELFEPEFEVATIPYNVLHVTMAAGRIVYVLRGAEPTPQESTLDELETLVDSARFSNPSLMVGLGIMPGVPLRDVWAALAAIQRAGSPRTIINAPLPGSAPEVVGWRKPEEPVSMVLHAPWMAKSRWRAAG